MIGLIILTVGYLAWSIWAIPKWVKHIKDFKHCPPMLRRWYWLELPYEASVWAWLTVFVILIILVVNTLHYLVIT